MPQAQSWARCFFTGIMRETSFLPGITRSSVSCFFLSIAPIAIDCA